MLTIPIIGLVNSASSILYNTSGCTSVNHTATARVTIAILFYLGLQITDACQLQADFIIAFVSDIANIFFLTGLWLSYM